ncbi:MAG: hypothetical protein RLZZ444_4125, partial [Pseudomonadota bacterium]
MANENGGDAPAARKSYECFLPAQNSSQSPEGAGSEALEAPKADVSLLVSACAGEGRGRAVSAAGATRGFGLKEEAADAAGRLGAKDCVEAGRDDSDVETDAILDCWPPRLNWARRLESDVTSPTSVWEAALVS